MKVHGWATQLGSGLLVLSVAIAIGCTKPSFGPIASNGPGKQSDPKVPVPTATPDPVYEVFHQDQGANQVDILVISDNSRSMLVDQKKLGAKFTNFTSALQDVDWHIGVTTTDVDSKTGLKGALAPFANSGEFVLTPQMADAKNLFLNTVVRPESKECEKDPYKCGSGNEQPLAATILAMSKAKSANKGFFRDNVDFVTLTISDEDEMSEGKSKDATTPEAVTAYVKNLWGISKKFAAYGIVIQPGDNACLTQQRAEKDSAGYFGQHVFDLAFKTGGLTTSICEADYGSSLKAISDNVRKLINSFELSRTPMMASVVATLTPAQNIGYRVEGRRVIFDRGPKAGTRIDIKYTPAD